MKKLLVLLTCVGLLAPAVPSASASPTVAIFICFDKATRKVWKPNARGVVRGTNRADVIVVNRPNTIVKGRGGNDRICTGRGAQEVWGGAGHDLISTWRGIDRAHGGPGRDYLNGGPGDDHLEGGYRGSDTLVGGGGSDVLKGGHGAAADDFLFGGGGEDRLAGGEGEDHLIGGDGADILDGSVGSSDTVSFAFEEAGVVADLRVQGTPLTSGDVLHGIENVHGSVFDDTLIGTREANVLHGDDGNDTISSDGGHDVVDGGAGADVLEGGGPTDLLSFLDAGSGIVADLAAGTSSDGDSVTGFKNIEGSAHDDELYGDDDENDLFGSRGTNMLFGRAGNDLLVDGSGGDAGEGDDLCFDSGDIANCEVLSHGDPAAFSLVDAQLHGTTREISSFTKIQGIASAGAFGPPPRTVQVALRRMSESGCYWWDASVAYMQQWHCDRPIWNATSLDRDGTWTKRVPSPVQLLDAGRYEVWSRINNDNYTENQFVVPYNVVEFRLR